MKPNNLLFVSNMEEAGGVVVEPATEHTVQNFYLSALFSVNITTPAPADEYVVLSNPTKIHRIVETVGILAALAVGAIIIIGVAFIMSKLRKRDATSEEDDMTSCEVVTEATLGHAPYHQPHHEASLPHYDIKHVYSITGVIVSTPQAARRSLKATFLPNFLKKKPTELATVHEALKKDLSRIYVY